MSVQAGRVGHADAGLVANVLAGHIDRRLAVSARLRGERPGRLEAGHIGAHLMMGAGGRLNHRN